MIQCPNCMSGSLSVKKFICTTEDYRIIDDDNNLLLVTETHEQPLEENAHDNLIGVDLDDLFIDEAESMGGERNE